jgi:hypothetical protein
LDSIERNQRKQQQMLPPKSEEELMPPPEAIPNVHLHHRRALPKLNKPSAAITDDLYEGLKLAQRGRLEDQRGTEIKFEMPDFLKRGTVRTFALLINRLLKIIGLYKLFYRTIKKILDRHPTKIHPCP